jgi:septal ring factor EnvC (AmiA/AmiB activator)
MFFKQRFLFVLILATGSWFPVPGSFVHASQRDLAAVQRQIRQAEAQNRQIDAQMRQSDANIDRTRRDLVRAAQRVERLETERAAIQNKIAELDARHGQLTESIEANRGRISEAAAALLIMSGAPVTQTDNASEYVLSSVLLAGIADAFDAEMRAAAERVKELEHVREQQRAEQTRLDRTMARYSAQRTELDQLLRTRTAQNERLRVQQMESQRTLRDLSARARNLAELTDGLAGGGAVSVDSSFSSRRLRPPVSGRLVMRFGERSGLGLVSDGWRIRTRADALVTAPADGRIEFSDNFRGYGRVLIIAHRNSYYSVLTGMASTDVMIGQEVLAGEPIGRMPSAQSEMYLEIRRGNRAIDPVRIFTEPR